MITKVSIIMATYNRAHFIIETLQSIQKQSFQNWECLIIDDGSTDNTLETITPILNSDSRFKFLTRPENYKKGLPGSRNYGLDLAKGNYIVFFDDDDIIHPQLLDLVLENFNDFDFVHYKKTPFFDKAPLIEKQVYEFNVLISVNQLYDIITNKIGLASCTLVWKNEVIGNDRFNENLLYAEEWEFYIRLFLKNISGSSIKNSLYFNRKHENSNTGEFYNNNPVRVQSKVDAILLVIENLIEKGKMTNEIAKYFIQLSFGFKEFDLTAKITTKLSSKNYDKLYWNIYVYFLKMKRSLKKIKKK